MNKTDPQAAEAGTKAPERAQEPILTGGLAYTSRKPSGRVSAVLGPTAGPDEGNVRAILSIVGILGVHALFALLIVAYVWASASFLHDLVTLFGGGVLAMDSSFASYYFGVRSAGG